MNTLKLNKYKTNNHISTPELNHHSIHGRRSRALAQALPTLNGRWYSSSQTKNYTTLFSMAGKPWASAPERLPRKYGWFSSGRKQHAFTIIEVVLVLAIAGLIFLMVFVALPALQRGQRDTQRKRDLEKALDGFARWQANNRGKTVHETTLYYEIIPNYLNQDGNEFRDPDGGAYHPTPGTVGVLPAIFKDSHGSTIIYRYEMATCDGDNTRPLAGYNNFALSMRLEGGGVYCVHS